ncbi:MAG TPA: universal stress protein, partial [Dehalococcoidia bacterium]|nr:universal stress protein [Dehalococcoidia bacterium]
MMGSIADKVLHGTSSPMLITHSKEGGSSTNASLKSMIIPLDGSSLAEQILPHATQVAKALGLNVILVR